jgi:hypothetical protein
MKKRLLIAAMAVIAMSAALWSSSITVNAPAAGANWCIGSTYSITWTKSGDMQATVAIRLRTAGSSEADPAAATICNGDPNDGSYSWTIPGSVAPGSYFIRVRTDDSTVIGDSGVFTIASCGGAASITVTSPNGAEWTVGNAYNIEWTKSGTMQATAAIRLRTWGSSEADPAALVIVDGTANDGSYSWTIPNSVAAGNYFIRVRTDDSTVSDDSVMFHIKIDGGGGHIDPGILEKLKKRRYWEIKWPPGPDPCLCPEWKVPRDFFEIPDLGNPAGSRLAGSFWLFKNGLKLQELGKFGRGKALPDMLRANLGKRDFGLLKNGGAKFSIVMLDEQGNILNESALEGVAQGLK